MKLGFRIDRIQAETRPRWSEGSRGDVWENRAASPETRRVPSDADAGAVTAAGLAAAASSRQSKIGAGHQPTRDEDGADGAVFLNSRW